MASPREQARLHVEARLRRADLAPALAPALQHVDLAQRVDRELRVDHVDLEQHVDRVDLKLLVESPLHEDLLKLRVESLLLVEFPLHEDLDADLLEELRARRRQFGSRPAPANAKREQRAVHSGCGSDGHPVLPEGAPAQFRSPAAHR